MAILRPRRRSRRHQWDDRADTADMADMVEIRDTQIWVDVGKSQFSMGKSTINGHFQWEIPL